MRTAVVLAGGEGRRIGAEKAFVMLCGIPLVAIVSHRVADVADEVVVVARDDNQAERLRCAVPGCRVVVDAIQGIGPLAGLYAGMRAARGRYAFATGCDMPFLDAEILDRLFLLAEGYDGAVPSLNGLLERLHAVYDAKRLGDACRNAIIRGYRRISSPLSELNINLVDASAFREIDPELLSFFNINTIEDLRNAERIAAERYYRRRATLPEKSG